MSNSLGSSPRHSKSFLLTLLSIYLINCIDSATICPPDELINPCACVENHEPLDISLFCLGDAITQSSINQLFTAIASSNNISRSPESGHWIGDGTPFIHHLAIAGTNLTTLDLTPFTWWSFNQFYVYRNQRLVSFTGPVSNSRIGLTAIDVHLDTNSLTDQSVSEFIKYLASTQVLRKFILRENAIKTSTKSWPSLDNFTQLKELDLSYNFIRTIGGGQFQKLTKLESLDLEGNQINEIKKDAFKFENDQDNFDRLLVIYLDHNKLTDAGIDSQNGLDTITRDTKVYLRNNQFEFISEKNFGKFILNPNFANVLKFWGCPTKCDDRMSWIKNSDKDGVSLQNFIFSVDCSNDPGTNIFNTQLV